MDHEQDAQDEQTQIGSVDMDINSPPEFGSIELNVPVLSAEYPYVEGKTPAVRLLPAGYENERTGLDEHLASTNEKKIVCSMSSIQQLFSFCIWMLIAECL